MYRLYNEIFNRDLKKLLIEEYRYYYKQALTTKDPKSVDSHMRRAYSTLVELEKLFFSVKWDKLTKGLIY